MTQFVSQALGSQKQQAGDGSRVLITCPAPIYEGMILSRTKGVQHPNFLPDPILTPHAAWIKAGQATRAGVILPPANEWDSSLPAAAATQAPVVAALSCCLTRQARRTAAQLQATTHHVCSPTATMCHRLLTKPSLKSVPQLL
ncbi:hypothetical protein Pmani_011552 [Petrolisthes manimaculis]|uniref:Uncharacterized protein n=1 Tax=Petrolisthes manimaculis TaxID=1843537 RepID=A0AAE1Q2A5_9EUCA|nr:hypothetical protein Pmani_011552 [Petrolisthes manimaculis]